MTPSNKISTKAGLPPGTIVHIGTRKIDKVKVSIIDYDATNLFETVCKSTMECVPFKEADTVSWINVDGLHDTEIIASIGKLFDLHHLLLEEVLNTQHRPKVEEFDNYLFLTLKNLAISKDSMSIESEQISFVLGSGWVISFHEQEEQGNVFSALRHHLSESKGNIRKKGADYLLYRLVDMVVDNYFVITEYISDVIEDLEEKVIQTPDNDSLQELQHIKKQLMKLRKAVIPLREAIATLEKDSASLFEESTLRYLRDVYEHIIHVDEIIEAQRDMLASIMDLYLSGVSYKMNQVMKVLTIIATIFIPLTFIAGIYGMNFDNMPELHWKFGYFGVWGIMIIVLIIMVVYLKRKRWI